MLSMATKNDRILLVLLNLDFDDPFHQQTNNVPVTHAPVTRALKKDVGSKAELDAPVTPYDLITEDLVSQALKKDVGSKAELDAPVTPYDLITEDLVSQALKKDEGTKTQLLSWSIKDFTHKGDNYASMVTSVVVKFSKNGSKHEKSYVVKLNPQRPDSEMTDFMERMYGRETIILSSVIPGMSREMEAIKQPKIKAPKVFSWNLKRKHEVFVAEDLRLQGFKMYNRYIGMDFNHALVVLEELGRFHASSLLFEDTLPNKSITDSFDYFEEAWKTGNSAFEMFSQMIAGQCKNASALLSDIPKYQCCVDWINKKSDNLGSIFIDTLSPTEKFNVLSHGDCWTNNMLFKYDAFGKPIDIRLLDFQISKKSSPACDLNYFLYTSVDRSTAQENYNKFKVTYYISFSKVLLLAGREPPFSYSEFEEEMDKRRIFGVFMAMFGMPIMMAESEDIFDPNLFTDTEEFLKVQKQTFSRMIKQSGAFKDRFLAIFDEVIEKRIFDL